VPEAYLAAAVHAIRRREGTLWKKQPDASIRAPKTDTSGANLMVLSERNVCAVGTFDYNDNFAHSRHDSIVLS
jgi:hypothetical protein